jgi:hypothetical protein
MPSSRPSPKPPEIVAMLQSKRRSSPSHLNPVPGRAGERVERSVPAQFLRSRLLGVQHTDLQHPGPKKFRRTDRKNFAVQKRRDSLDYAPSLLRSETNFGVSNLKSSCLPALASNQPASHPMFKTRRPCGPVPRFCNMPRRCSMVPHHRALRGGMGTLMVFLRSIIVESSRSEWTGWGPPLFCSDLSDG